MSSRAIAFGVVLVAARAFAGWSQVTLNDGGAPRDVSVEGEGLFTVATTTEAAVYGCDGGACVRLSTPAPQGGSFDTATAQLDAGCILAVQAGTSALFGCQTGSLQLPAQRGLRARHAASGFTGIWGHDNTSQGVISTGPNPSSTPTQSPYLTTVPGGRLPALSAVSVGGNDFVVAGTSTSALRLISPGSATTTINTSPISFVADAQLFRRADGGLGLVVAEFSGGANNGLILMGTPESDGGFAGSTPRNPYGFMRSIAYSEEQGSALGFGFGMAPLEDAGFIGSVPNPSSPGELWVRRPSPPGSQQLRQVSCASPRFCVAINLAAAPNTWVYWNDAAPDASFSTIPALAIGAPLTVTLNAGDLDDDPVFVTWELDAGILSVTPSDDGGDNRDARIVASQCGTQTLTARVSDGYAPHGTSFSVPVNVNVGIPDAPVVMPLMAMTTQAGGASRTFSVSVADAGCPASGVAWRLAAGPGTLDGGTYFPPATLCAAAGADVVIEARALGNPDASVPAIGMVHVDPWGFPNAPMISGGTQSAGTDASYPLVGQRHACEDAGAPITVSWVVDGGAPGVTWAATASGLTVYSTDSCGNGTVSGQVTYSVAGQSASSTVTVDVVPTATPPTGFSMGYGFDAGLALGRFSVAGAGCITPGRFTADVVANDMATGARVAAIPQQDVATNPSWQMPIIGACNGGTYEVIGTLYPSMLTDRAVSTLGHTDAGVAAIDTALDVSCTGGVDGTVQVSTVPGSCQGQTYVWEQLSGPALQSDLRDGGSIHVASMEPGFELIGETIRWRVTATAGPGNTAATEFDVRLRHRFIELAHAVGPQAASSDDLQTVTIKVRNTEPCGASAIELDELPTGLQPIAASARVDGEVVASAVRGDGHLVVGPFPVSASQTREVTYLARVPLFSRPAPSGVAMMKGEEVSLSEGLVFPVAAGCGCSSSGSLLLLASLVAMTKRRRPSPRPSPLRGEREA